jgi:MerR family transcriptional regulator, light-induced transcriptional regulator
MESIMSTPESRNRRQLAAAIKSLRGAVAEEATDQFLVLHPDWIARYGDRARQFGIEDAGYHQDFLAAAIMSGEPKAFHEYAGWAARMLLARGIEPRFLAESLQQIGQALRGRLGPPDAEIVDSYIRQGAERCLDGEAKAAPEPISQLVQLTRMYTEAAIGGNRQAALALVLEAVRQGHPVIDLYAEVLQAAMYRIGRLWEENRISVAQEHMATAITQFVMAQLYPLIELPQNSSEKIVITGVPGEFHQVGANMIADVLEASGWDVRFLGTDTPSKGVLDAVEEHEARILGISATMLFSVPQVIRLAEQVRERSGDRISIIVGGAAFRLTPGLCEEIGAKGYALDVRSAIRLVSGLTLSGS